MEPRAFFASLRAPEDAHDPCCGSGADRTERSVDRQFDAGCVQGRCRVVSAHLDSVRVRKILLDMLSVLGPKAARNQSLEVHLLQDAPWISEQECRFVVRQLDPSVRSENEDRIRCLENRSSGPIQMVSLMALGLERPNLVAQILEDRLGFVPDEASDEFRPCIGSDFGSDAVPVGLDRPFPDSQMMGDRLVGMALSSQPHDLLFAG